MKGISTNQPISQRIAACLAADGQKFVFRYYAQRTRDPEKRLTAPEARRLRAAGLDIGIVFENSGATSFSYFTQAQGTRDGAGAAAIGHGLGQPTGTAIYFAADFEVKPRELAAMRAYFRAVRDAMAAAGNGAPPYAMGVYGSGLLCAALLDAGLVTFTWLSESMGFEGSPEFDQSGRWNVKQALARHDLCGLRGRHDPAHDDYEDNQAPGEIGAWKADLRPVPPRLETVARRRARRTASAETISPLVEPVRTVADGVTLFRLKAGKAMFFTSDMDVDADGCPRAYKLDDTGIEALKNAKKKNGRFSPNVLVLDGNGTPLEQGPQDPAPGFLISKTALEKPGADENPADPKNYTDALTIPYIVIPGGQAGGAAPGHPALVIDLDHPQRRVYAIVGDVGSEDETGEASMLCAGLISGLTPAKITEALARTSKSVINPRNGGPGGKRYRYVVFTARKLVWPQSVKDITAAVKAAMATLEDEELTALIT